MMLENLWYLVIIAALIFYAVLDGFDLGVGALHLFTKKDEDRRIFLNSIGPVWDGNEVWLVIVIGALFAGFPEAYATLFSSFYNLTMLLVCGLIFRAAAIEFRSKHPSVVWRRRWDAVFSVASISIAFEIGLILGNLIEGIPLDAHHDFVGTYAVFFRPYALILAISVVALFMMHGSIFLTMKTEGALHKQLRHWVNRSINFFIASILLLSIATFFQMPHMLDPLLEKPWLFVIPLLAFTALILIPQQIKKGNDGTAFIYSCLMIALFLSLFAIGTFPILIRSTINPLENSLFVHNAAASPLTMKVLLTIVLIGLPLVFAYGAYIYKTFRGKVRIDKHSY